MGKTTKLVICGSRGCGKTAFLEQLIYARHKAGQTLFPTIEDIYVAEIETDKGVRDKIRFYDTAGLSNQQPHIALHYYSLADAFILMYTVTEIESFMKLDLIKHEIDRLREKREIPVALVGMKLDLESDRQVDLRMIATWAQREKVRSFQASVTDRRSLLEPVQYLLARLTPVQKTGPFIGRKKTQTPADL